MANAYGIIAKHSTGATLASLDGFTKLNVNLITNQIGNCELLFPLQLFPSSYFAADNLIEIWRSVDGNLPKLLGGTAFFMRKLSKLLQPDGTQVWSITGADVKDVTARRIVAYANQTTYAGKLAAADDMIKAYANENMGAGSVDTTRNLGSYLVIAPNLTAAPVVSDNAPHRRLSDLFKEITDESFTAGQYLAWDIGYDPANSLPILTLNTYTQQRGVDHRWPTSAFPLFLDPEQGSLTEVERSWDYRDLRNRIYAGGSGVAGFQPISTANDLTSQGLGPFMLAEEFLAISNTSDPVALVADGFEALRRLRARRTFTARAVNTPFMRFGLEYDLGDFMSGSIFTELLDARADGISINIQDGDEQVNLILRADT